jgi:hypothetical protein
MLVNLAGPPPARFLPPGTDPAAGRPERRDIGPEAQRTARDMTRAVDGPYGTSPNPEPSLIEAGAYLEGTSLAPASRRARPSEHDKQ